MNFRTWRQMGMLMLLTSVLTSGPAAAQQSAVTIDDGDITIRGCVSGMGSYVPERDALLVWSRGDIMMAGAKAVRGDGLNPVGTTGVPGRVFYWLKDNQDLSEHVGQLVEIRGELDDLERGEIEIDRDGDFTEIKLDLDGKKEKARVPSSWLGPSGDRELDIAAWSIDVDDLRVLGACW